MDEKHYQEDTIVEHDRNSTLQEDWYDKMVAEFNRKEISIGNTN
jgi:hypothetical protein